MGFFAYALNDKCECGLFGVLLFWIFADALRIVHGGGCFSGLLCRCRSSQ